MLVCKNLGTRSPSSPFFPQSNHLSSGLPGPKRGGGGNHVGEGGCTPGCSEGGRSGQLNDSLFPKAATHPSIL
jgi:hypothetical protein